MDTYPLISIIIPTLNRAHLIGDTLDSVLAQTYKNWECIIVDDGSTDNTEAILNDYCVKDNRFQYHKRPKNHLPGGNGARNYGFKLSKGHYIQWFDSDDLMLPDKLKIQMNALLTSDKKVHLCSGRRYNPITKLCKDLKLNLKDGIFRQIALNSSEIMTPSILIERETFIKSKVLFFEKLSRGQETYFFMSLISVIDNNLILQGKEKLFVYLTHNQTISKSDEEYNKKHSKSKAIVYSKIWSLSTVYKDVDVANRMYRKSIRLLFKAIKHKDYKFSEYILDMVKSHLKKTNKHVYKRVYLYCIIMRVFKYPKYRLMNGLLKLKVNL